MNNIESIVAAGEALYGDRWREPLARALQRPGATKPGVSWRLLRYWVDGERPVPAWLLPELATILRREARARQRALTKLAADLEASMA